MSEENAIGNATQNVLFDSSNPFPHIPVAEISYGETKKHASLVDKWLGLKVLEVELSLNSVKNNAGSSSLQTSSQELWIGLPPQSLLTPYIEFRQILELLKLSGHETVIDCGAAYGRMGFVLARHFPQVNFVGFEVVRERVEEGKRCLALWNCGRAKLVRANIDAPEFDLPEAEIYFIYDFSHRQAINRLLDRIQRIARKRKVTVVARGRSSRDAIERSKPWLSEVNPPEHFPNFSIYRS